MSEVAPEDTAHWLQVPFVCDEENWKTVRLEVHFDVVGEPLLVSADTSNLNSVEKERLLRWLATRSA